MLLERLTTARRYLMSAGGAKECIKTAERTIVEIERLSEGAES